MDSTRARIARDYIDRGWIPFAYAGEKLPPYGWQNTTVDAGTVDRIARNTFPVGILTGKPSNLVVVDIDKQNGGDFDALVSRYGKENLFTYVVATPSGGWHLYYRYPEGVEKLTKVIKTGRGIPELRGIDLLADGCHVIAPPTVRVGDGRKAPGEYKVVQNVDVAELPKQLLEDWLAATERKPLNLTSGSAGEIRPENYGRAIEMHNRFVQNAVEAVEGTRDNTSYSCICNSVRIAMALPDDVLSVDQVAEDYKILLPYEVRDLAGKMERAIKWAETHPWIDDDPDNDGEVVEVPDTVHPDDAQEYRFIVRRELLRRRALEHVKQIEIDEAARSVEVPELVDIDEFLRKDPPQSEWLIEDLFQNGGSVLLSAQYKAGKTTFVLNLMRSLTVGPSSLFLGKYRVPEPLRVAWFDLELGQAKAHKWLREMRGLNRSNASMKDLKGRGRTLDLRSGVLFNALARQLRESRMDVLIVDPISPVMSALGLNENEANSVRPLLDAFDALAAEAGLRGVVIVHHAGHEAANRARGSSAFMDWASALWNLTKEGDHLDATRRFSAMGRDVAVEPIPLDYDPAERRYRVAETPFDGHTSWESWLVAQRGRDITTDEAMETMGCSKSTALERLRRDGWRVAVEGRRGQPAVWRWEDAPNPFDE